MFMRSRVMWCSSLCLFAVLVSLQLPAQSQKAQPLHRAKVSKGLTPQSAPTFATAVHYYSGGNGANAAATASLRGTGQPVDVVVTNWCSDINCTGGSVAVLLGNGNGTISMTPVAYSSGGLFADSVAIADVNGDGKLDLVVANCGSSNQSNCVSTSNSGNVAVLLGNGDGSFQPAVTYSLGASGATSVAVADLNNDGFPDLIVGTGSNTAGLVGVLIGNGNGTFQTVQTYPSGGLSPAAVAVADLGNGKFDVVVGNTWADSTETSSNVGVLIGNGDGTFQTAVAYPTGGFFPDSIAIADVNGDGKPDMVVANSSVTSSSGSLGNVGVLLGNGNGAFGTTAAYLSGGYGAASVAVADVNGDGLPDIVVANCSGTSGDCTFPINGNVGVLVGNGDGTFGIATTFGAGGDTPFGIAVGDLNGDGKPDIVAANCVSGNCGAGNGELGVLLNSTLTPTATALVSSANPSIIGQSVTFTATVTDLPGFDKGVPTGTVTFFNGTTAIGSPVPLNGTGGAAITTSALAVGTASITATYSGDTNFATSTSSALPQVVQLGQTATALTSSPNPSNVGQTVTLTAAVTVQSGTGTPTGTVSFFNGTTQIGSAVPLSGGGAAITTSTLAAGTASLTATYSGDTNFATSTSPAVQQVVQGAAGFTLAAKPSTVTVSAPGASGSATITITTTGNLKASSVGGFACSGLPSESTCTFGAVSSSGTVSLSIATTGASAKRSPLFGHHQQLFYAMLLPGFLGMVYVAGRRRALRGLRLLSLIVVLGLAALWVACGGGSPSTTPPPNTGTPTGNSTVTVSATSGTLQGSVKFTLTVQ